ncbi:hypothetical protein [Sporomusa acidovorans]|uniref:hypothetical protein n=1 Tax=Sporomusa acidovorans TaxID=112900 RepID=UPI0015A3B6E2|nr:hypothetical protein [Sporomusa acidovorans]
MHNGRPRLSTVYARLEQGEGDPGNPGNSRTPPAFAGKSVPQEKSRAVFRKKIRTV